MDRKEASRGSSGGVFLRNATVLRLGVLTIILSTMVMSAQAQDPTGSCCYNIGPGSTSCRQNVTAATCSGLPVPNVFRPGQECSPLNGNNQGPDFGNGPCCSTCTTNTACNDGNACTDDICTSCDGCVNTNNFNDTTDCCDPFSGILTPITDFEICTDDVCDSQTGQVSHTPIVGCAGCITNTDCFDNNACTNDTCNTTTGDCSHTANFNEAIQCCTPGNSSLTPIDDFDPCTDDSCDAQTGQVSHTPIAGCVGECKSIADAIAGNCPQNIPTVSEWGLVVLSLLLLIGGKLYFGRSHVIV